MITSNLLINFDLINVAIGILHNIIWQTDNDFYPILLSKLVFIPNQYHKDSFYLF